MLQQIEQKIKKNITGPDVDPALYLKKGYMVCKTYYPQDIDKLLEESGFTHKIAKMLETVESSGYSFNILAGISKVLIEKDSFQLSVGTPSFVLMVERCFDLKTTHPYYYILLGLLLAEFQDITFCYYALLEKDNVKYQEKQWFQTLYR